MSSIEAQPTIEIPTGDEIQYAHDIMDIIINDLPVGISDQMYRDVNIVRSVLGYVIGCGCGEDFKKYLLGCMELIHVTGGKVTPVEEEEVDERQVS